METAGKSGLAASGLLLFPVMASLQGTNASVPHGMTLGLSQYSLRFLFRDKILDVLDFPMFAKETFGIDHIDLWEGGIPEGQREELGFYQKIKQAADDAGTNIFLFMTGVVDATGEIREERLTQAVNFFPAADKAAILGCQYLRIFVRAPGINVTDAEEAARRCAEAIRPLSVYARQKGITVVIEPGASDYSSSGYFLADVVKAVQHPNCALMPDFGKLKGDIYQGTQAMMPHAAVISAKSHNFDEHRNEVDFDYYRLMKIIVESGFKGIIAIEYEGTVMPPVEGVKATKALIMESLKKA